MSKKLTAKEKALQQQRFAEDVVADVKQDFQNRQNFRRPYELAWQLNMNFVMGNQYCAISPRGAIEQEEKYYFWQEKQVYNHIAPIVETRLARLTASVQSPLRAHFPTPTRTSHPPNSPPKFSIRYTTKLAWTKLLPKLPLGVKCAERLSTKSRGTTPKATSKSSLAPHLKSTPIPTSPKLSSNAHPSSTPKCTMPPRSKTLGEWTCADRTSRCSISTPLQA